MVRLLPLTLLGILQATAPSFAQGNAEPSRPPVEVGVGIDKISTFGYGGEIGLEGFDAPAVSVRGTFPFTARYAIEGMVSFERRDERYLGSRWVNEMTEVMYAIQIKRGRRQKDKRVHGFATFGAAGAMYRRIRPERTVLVPPGGERVLPRSIDQTVYPPVAALLGGGVQYDFASRMGFRADAQVAMLLYVPVAARVSASLTIPFGPYKISP